MIDTKISDERLTWLREYIVNGMFAGMSSQDIEDLLDALRELKARRAEDKGRDSLKVTWEFYEGAVTTSINCVFFGSYRDLRALDARLHYYEKLDAQRPSPPPAASGP